MTRALIGLVVGVLLGVGATLWLAPSPRAPELAVWRPPAAATLPSTPAIAPAEVREAGRDFYRRLAEADAAELAAMIALTAAQTPSPDRELALAVQLKRYAELDAVRAVRLARELRVGSAALGAVYGAWARAAPEQVLAALSTVDSTDDAANVALALIMALGDDAAAVNRVAAVLAAREDGASAAGVAPALGPIVVPAGPMGAATPPALALTAQRWADLDPRRALAATLDIDDERTRLVFEGAALRALAREAPDEAFAQLASRNAPPLELGTIVGAVIELARADPAQLLKTASGLPQDVRRVAEQAALQRLAELDPLTAWRHAETMPAGPERQRLSQLVARQYGRHDAAAALAWARGLAGEQMLVSSVIAGVAERDPGHALDLALGLDSVRERMQSLQAAVTAGARQDATVETVANRVMTLDPAFRDSLAVTMVSMWASRSPDSAMRWLVAGGRSAPPNAFQQVGQQLAMRDPQSALAYSAQVPPAARDAWNQGVAQGYAQADPQAGIDWLAQYRNERWYASAATTLGSSLAQRDAAAAARFVDTIDTEGLGMDARRLVSAVASSWAYQNPSVAADWAMSRASEQERTFAVQSALGIWSARDADGARQWTLRLPRGAVRDAALGHVLNSTVAQTSGGPDVALLTAFSSDQARQTAVLQLVQTLTYDVTRARAIAEAHLSDPRLRTQADRIIEGARNGNGPRPIGLGIVEPTRVLPVR